MPFSNARISNSRAETYAATSSSPVVDNAASDDWADRVRASSVLARLRDLAGCIFSGSRGERPGCGCGLVAVVRGLVYREAGVVVRNLNFLMRFSGLFYHLYSGRWAVKWMLVQDSNSKV